MQLKLLNNIVNEKNIDAIIKEYKDKKIFYMQEDKFDGWIYLTKDVLVLDNVEFWEYLNKMAIINNIILKKAVFNIMNKDIQALAKIGMPPEMVDIMQYVYNRWNYTSWDKIPLTYYGRFDMLLDSDDGKLKMVEINSETPAWYPEAVTNEIIFNNTSLKTSNYTDINADFKMNFYTSLYDVFHYIKKNKDTKPNFLFTFVPACWKYFEIKKDYDWEITFDQQFDEDYICGIHMTSFFYDQLNDSGINVKIWNTDDIELREDGLYYEGLKQDYVWSFYPLEWFFTDQGNTDFWKLYKEWKFEIVNNPLNLITQSKAIWAYIHENIKNWDYMGMSDDEISLFLDIVPEYRFSVWKEEVKNYVSKPLYYREWVGIDNSDYVGTMVYQKRINQAKIDIETFDWTINWYLTIGLYYGEDWFIGSYTRFCENAVTDFTAYYLPTVWEDK